MRRSRRFGRAPRAAVTRSDIPMPKLKSRRKCASCGQILTTGEAVVRLRLKKLFQQPCTVCSHKPTKLKFFHAACCPPDINAAMGYDPNVVNAAPQTPRPGAPVAPPPKPQTPEDAALAALVSLEHALKIKASKMRVIPPDLEAKFKTFQGIKARVLRPGSPAEGETATALALKRIVDMVFA